MTSSCVAVDVLEITPLTETMLRLVLKADVHVPYYAGQYLEILLGNEVFAYSIANAPLGAQHYELHLRHRADNPLHQRLLLGLEHQTRLNIRVPLGSCHVERLHPHLPILCLAGGVGMAPIKSMIEQLWLTHDTRPVDLFWGVRSQAEFYLMETLARLKTQRPDFRCVTQMSDVDPRPLVFDVIAQHAKDLCDWQFVLSGPFEMVYHARDQLLTHGVSPTRLFSDALDVKKEGDQA